MGNDVESTDSKSFTKFDIHAEIKAFWICSCSLCVTYRGHHDATYPRIRIVISHSNQLFRYLGVTHNRRELSSRWDGSNEWHIFKYAACRPLYELSSFPSSSSVPSSMPSKCNPFRSISFWLLIQINIMEKGPPPLVILAFSLPAQLILLYVSHSRPGFINIIETMTISWENSVLFRIHCSAGRWFR